MGLICLLGLAGLAGQVHEVESKHVRCEVHGGFRHHEAPADSPADVHTDDHGDLKFLQYATAPWSFVACVPVRTWWRALVAPVVHVALQKKVWAIAPKGSPPRA